MLSRLWFRIRHRRSRAEIVAFSMGIEVGRATCGLTKTEIAKMTDRVKDGYS